MKKKITAFVLAGGKGTRLLPLSATTPKPLLPLRADGETLLLRLLRQLRDAGIPRAVLCCGDGAVAAAVEEAAESYRPSLAGMELLTVRDGIRSGGVGSAAGVRAAREKLLREGFLAPDERMAVFCGDGWFRGDLRPFFEAPDDADALLLLSRSSRFPTALGNVRMEPDGRVTAFREKPSWGQVDGSPVSTGAYLLAGNVFEGVPAVADFGRDLWRALLERGRLLRGVCFEGEWRDVGSPADYLAVCLSESGGKSVIGEGCSLGSGVRVRESLLGRDCRVGSGAVIGGSILGEHCVIGERAILQRGCVLGAGCAVGAGAFLGEGTILPSKTVIGAEQTVRLPAALPEGLFGDNRLLLPTKELGGSFPFRLGMALSEAAGGSLAGVSEPGCGELRQAILRGATRRFDALDAGDGSRGMAAFLARKGEAALCFFLSYLGEGRFSLLLFDTDGQYPGALFERRLADALRRAALTTEEESDPDAGRFTRRRGLRGEYLAALLERLPEELDREIHFSLSGDGFAPDRALLREVIAQRSVTPSKKPPITLRFEPGETAQTLSASEGEWQLPPFQLTGILAGFTLRRQKSGARRIVLPENCPEALKRMVRGSGAKLLTLSHTCSDPAEKAAREAAASQPWLFDGCFAAVELLRALWLTGASLRELCMLIPKFCYKELPAELAESHKAALLRRYAGDGTEDGILREDEESGGYTRLAARAGDRLLLSAEAADEYAADALLRRAKSELRRLARKTRRE